MNKRNNFICEFSNKTKRQSRRASNKTQANNEHKKKIYSNLIEAIIQILLETLVSLLRSLVWNDSQRRRHRPQWERVRRHWMREGEREKKKKNSTWLRNRLFENLWGNFKALLVFCWLWSAARHSNGARRLQALLWYVLRTHTHNPDRWEVKVWGQWNISNSRTQIHNHTCLGAINSFYVLFCAMANRKRNENSKRLNAEWRTHEVEKEKKNRMSRTKCTKRMVRADPTAHWFQVPISTCLWWTAYIENDSVL